MRTVLVLVLAAAALAVLPPTDHGQKHLERGGRRCARMKNPRYAYCLCTYLDRYLYTVPPTKSLRLLRK